MLAARDERFGQLRHASHGFPNQGSGQVAEGGRHRIHQQQAPRREGFPHERGECGTHGVARLPGAGDEIHNVIGKRKPRQCLPQVFQGQIGKRSVTHRAALEAAVGLHVQTCGNLSGTKNPGVIYFREIVVFGCQPEDRYGGNAPLV